MSINLRRILETAFGIAVIATAAGAADTKPQTFTVPQTWNIPAATLQPGNYSIRIVDQMADRAIVTVESADGSVHSTFIAVPDRSVPVPAHSGPVMWSTAGDTNREGTYVRGWRFPGDSRVMQFAYPKAVAVSIAKHQKSPVPAVDPDSEGMKPVPNALASKTDMEVISLWLLSANPVGPDPEKAEIKAARYQPGTDAPQPKHVAAVTGTKLPKTASELPVVFLFASLCFVIAFSIRYIRKSRTEMK